MIALRLRSPRGEDRPLTLPPGHHSAGGGTSDALPLPGAPEGIFDLELSAETAIVLPRRPGVRLGARALRVGERWLLRPGHAVSACDHELLREAEPGPGPAEGTAALARGLLCGGFGQAPVPLPTLVWLNGRDCGKRLPLLDEATFLGRGDGAMARVRDALASRTHAKLLMRDGRALLSDLSSANGLFVDGQPITGERELVGGEVLRLGETELLFEAALARSRPPPPPMDAAPAAAPEQPASAAPARRRIDSLEIAVVGGASLAGAVATAAVFWLAG